MHQETETFVGLAFLQYPLSSSGLNPNHSLPRSACLSGCLLHFPAQQSLFSPLPETRGTFLSRFSKGNFGSYCFWVPCWLTVFKQEPHNKPQASHKNLWLVTTHISRKPLPGGIYTSACYKQIKVTLHTAETNTTLQSNYTAVKIFLKSHFT